MKLAKRNAKRHNINVIHGRPNDASGNCAFEAVIYNIQDRRELSPEQKINLSILESRRLWITELQSVIESNHPEIPRGLESQWKKIKEDGVYEVEIVGDLMMNAISRGCKKDLLIFNTHKDAPSPIFVVKASQFGGDVDSPVPVVLCYNGVHYESLHTVSPQDVWLTQKLLQSYTDGTYAYDIHDMSYLLAPLVDSDRYQKPWPQKPGPNYESRVNIIKSVSTGNLTLESRNIEGRDNEVIINNTPLGRKMSKKEQAAERKRK